jgi:hypothetical protein
LILKDEDIRAARLQCAIEGDKFHASGNGEGQQMRRPKPSVI